MTLHYISKYIPNVSIIPLRELIFLTSILVFLSYWTNEHSHQAGQADQLSFSNLASKMKFILKPNITLSSNNV